MFVIGDRDVECERRISSSRGKYEEWTRWSEVIPDIDATSQHHTANIPPVTNLGIETSEPQMNFNKQMDLKYLDIKLKTFYFSEKNQQL